MKLGLGSLRTAQDNVSSCPSEVPPQGRGAREGSLTWCCSGPTRVVPSEYPWHRGGNSGSERELVCLLKAKLDGQSLPSWAVSANQRQWPFGQFLPVFVQVRLESCSDEPQSQWIVDAVAGEPGTLSPPASPAHP